MLTILVAPSGFKESLDAGEVADAIAQGLRRVLPAARILKAPMVDGGEGFTRALVAATGGSFHPVRVTGPVGEPVEAGFGFLGRERVPTAVIEMAAAAGLRLVPRDRRDPTATTSRGVGELIRAALDAGARRILLGCGDSGVSDGGVGMAQALGVRVLDAEGREIGPGGAELRRIARIDMSGRDPRLAGVTIDAAVNWHNLLTGPRGVARVFGPQKGASPAQVEALSAGLDRLAALIEAATGLDLRLAPGAGASGGLGAGLVAFAGARLHPRFELVMRYLDFDALLEKADLVVTAEGSLDGQTPFGKVPAEVAARAKRRGLPVIALAGTIGDGASATLASGIDAFASILCKPCTIEEAIARAAGLVRHAAQDAGRMIGVGMMLKSARRRPDPAKVLVLPALAR
jgi:glycerate kinase